MLFAASAGELELRAVKTGGARLRGRFPYGQVAVLFGNRKEKIAPRAFARRVNSGDDLHLLARHSFDQPLASKATGTLELRDGDDALTFDAEISPEIAATSHGADILRMIEAGLSVGISPGFRLANRNAEKIEQVDGAVLRTVTTADLYEISIVTMPAYDQAQVAMRNWQLGPEPSDAGLRRMLSRWRA